jgi:radical SAM superfamily enzyme YgiQ (UPF0313 family)
MKFLFVGGKCSKNCFADYGGCDVHKQHRDEEPTIQRICFLIGYHMAKHEQVFLYTPDMLSDQYYESVFQKLPKYESTEGPYIAINASVDTMRDKIEDMNELLSRGIREVWLGVESASILTRKRYGKPKFTNKELLDITRKAQDMGINVCWYLIDNPKEDAMAKLFTFELIVRGKPFRVRFAKINR